MRASPRWRPTWPASSPTPDRRPSWSTPTCAGPWSPASSASTPRSAWRRCWWATSPPRRPSRTRGSRTSVVMSAGRVPHNPSELLGSHRMQLLLQDLSHDHLVVLDAPPLLPVTDAALLAGIADGAIVVFAIGQTYKEQARLAKRRLGQTGGRMLGVVLNRAPLRVWAPWSTATATAATPPATPRVSRRRSRVPARSRRSRRPPAEESDAGQGPGRAGGACPHRPPGPRPGLPRPHGLASLHSSARPRLSRWTELRDCVADR